MDDKYKSTPPKPPGEVAVESKVEDTPEYLMVINFKQDREEYLPNQALVDALKLNDALKLKAGLYVQGKNYRNCVALNCFLKQLIVKSGIDENGNTQGNPDATQAMSLVTFITEASEHPEYCTTYMLRKFSNCIFVALEEYVPTVEDISKGDTTPSDIYGFKDCADDYGNQQPGADATLRFMGILQPITPEILKTIHETEHSPEGDIYRCQSDNIIHLLIQVCYAILMHYFRNGDIIRICGNCGQIFIPSRENMKYCTRMSPQNKSKSCGQYIKYQQQRIHNNNDEFKKEHDRILRRLDSEETTDFQKEYNYTKGDPEARRKIIEKWAEKYPKRKKGAKQND